MTLSVEIVLTLSEGQRSAAEIAKELKASPSSVRSCLLSLERRGLVKAVRAPASGRTFAWKLVK